MEDRKGVYTGMEVGSGDEYKKLVDKFLTVKALPDKEQEKLHFEKMLEAFRGEEAEKNTGVLELSDDEIGLVAAAGTGSSGLIRCSVCGMLLQGQSQGEHMRLAHNK